MTDMAEGDGADRKRGGGARLVYETLREEILDLVLKPGAPLFHYTGTPNAKTSGRDVPGEVIKRLEKAGFRAERKLDGVFATNGRGATPARSGPRPPR